MAGIANSWIEQYTSQQTPCIGGTSTGVNLSAGTFSNCLLWLALGLFLGSLSFQKKGNQQ